MAVRVAVLDANVLYSIEHTDVLLTLAVRRLVRVHWSSTLLDELRRNLALRPDLTTAAIDYRIEQMSGALPSALADAPAEVTASMPINEKDRHVLALAVHIEADAIVTWNLRDFPTSACEPHGIEALTPDQFLTGVAATDTPAAREAVDAIAARRHRPPMTTAALLDRLSTTLPTFVATVRAPRERPDS